MFLSECYYQSSSNAIVLTDHDIGHYIPKVKAAIESILRTCHKAYSQALLTSSRTTIGNLHATNIKNGGIYFPFLFVCLFVFCVLMVKLGEGERLINV